MEEHANARRFRQAMEGSGDATGFQDLLADDVVWHEIGGNEPIHGKQAVMDSLAGWIGDVEGQVHDVLANDDHVVAMVEAVARRGDEELRYRTVEVMDMHGGKVVERWSFTEDPAAVTRFFS